MIKQTKTMEENMGRLGVFLLGAATGVIGLLAAAAISDKVSSSRQTINSTEERPQTDTETASATTESSEAGDTTVTA
jgi:hypothetical protein